MAEINFQYTTFYDVPREIFFEVGGDMFRMSSLYDDVIGEYSDSYDIYRTFFSTLSTYDDLSTIIDNNDIEYVYVGSIGINDLHFDSTFRQCFISKKMESILQSAKLQYELSFEQYLSIQENQLRDDREGVSRIIAFAADGTYLQRFIINVDSSCILLVAVSDGKQGNSETILRYNIYDLPQTPILPFLGLQPRNTNVVGQVTIEELMFDRTLRKFVKTDRLRSHLDNHRSLAQVESSSERGSVDLLPGKFKDTFDILDVNERKMQKRIYFFRSDLSVFSEIVTDYDVDGVEESETMTLFDELGEKLCLLVRGLNQSYLRRYGVEDSEMSGRQHITYDSQGNRISY